MLRISGDTQALNVFCWQPLPEFVAQTSCRSIKRYLSIHELMMSEVAGGGEIEDIISERSLVATKSWWKLWGPKGSSRKIFTSYRSWKTRQAATKAAVRDEVRKLFAVGGNLADLEEYEIS